jgi:hypothetical protein
MTEGLKSTEFWTKMVLIVAVTLLVALGKLRVEQIAELWPIFGLSGAYALSRGWAKNGK